MTAYSENVESTAKKIIAHVGKTIVIGVPLGIGKPIGLLNALYRLASADKTIDLTIITGLTLARPVLHNLLEKRFIEPILNRLLKNYEDPLYEKARISQQLPSNIKVIEFFLNPGVYLHNNYVQQNYISSIYTNVIRDSVFYSINVIGQQVAYSDDHPELYSLSCNSDLFDGVVQRLNKSKREGKNVAIVAEVNKNLPFMHGAAAVIKASVFTDIINTKKYPALFPLPREALSTQDHLIGLYTSTLIKDDSSLQIGIGKLSNAFANALILRHQNNPVYLELLEQLSINKKFSNEIKNTGSLSCFDKGLYAPTEMLSDGYIQLYKNNILKKRVYDHVGLQRLINLQKITENIQPNIMDILLENGVIHSKLTLANVKFLLKFGIFKKEVGFDEDNIILPSGEKIPADLAVSSVKQKIIEQCLGDKLQSGKIMHAGFFLGSADFYHDLNHLSPEELNLFEMTTIARTNSFQWSYKLAHLQHKNARFVNSAMMVTLGGVIVSDGLKNLQEVSGVGGQFDFVYMAQKLRQARSIIVCSSVRRTKHGKESNIIWDYQNYTIPRFLRDIVVTEYGIADCRSKTDAEVIKSILNITDSRFQEDLLKKAKKYGKLTHDYEIPREFQENNLSKFEPIIREFQLKGYCKPYVFGSDLTEEEQVLEQALLVLKYATKFKLCILIIISIFYFRSDSDFKKYLERMQLLPAKNLREWIYKKLLKLILRKKI